MRSWRWILCALICVGLGLLYLDERLHGEGARPAGFSTEAAAGSVFAIHLSRDIELAKLRRGDTIRFRPAGVIPYGSASGARLPADAVLEAQVEEVSSGNGRRLVLFQFKRVRARGRSAPISASLSVDEASSVESERSRSDERGAAGALIARSAKDNPLIVLAGYLSGTYLGDFLSRRTEAPRSFFTNELGNSIHHSTRLHIRLHRRAFIPH